MVSFRSLQPTETRSHPIYGTRTSLIQAAKRSFTWDFIIADVKTPLLEADFLSRYGLLVDVANGKFLNVATFRSNTLALAAGAQKFAPWEQITPTTSYTKNSQKSSDQSSVRNPASQQNTEFSTISKRQAPSLLQIKTLFQEWR